MMVKVNIGFQLLLTVIFATLKALGIINWSWLWVFAPIWITFVAIFTIFIIALVIKKYYEQQL